MRIPAYIFDCSDIETLDDFWDLWVRVVDGEDADMFGRNYDALRLALTGGGPAAPELPCVLVFAQHEALRLALGYRAEAAWIEAMLPRVPAGERAPMLERLAAAHQGMGPTPFSRLVNIIQENLRVRLVLH
jgi:RNAse (barnase) inhibitor barstar